MQSDGNSFCGDVVLGSFNMSSRNEDSILEQKYEKQISLDLYYGDFMLEVIEEKAYLRNTAHNNKELKKLGVRATVVLVSICVLCYKELISS